MWFPQSGNVEGLMPGTHITAVHFPADDLIGFATTNLGTVLFTSNGGETWKPQPMEFALPPLYSLDIRHDTLGGFAVGANGTLVGTTDGGNTWLRYTIGTEADLYSIRCYADGTVGIITGDELTLLQTQDNGNTWVQAAID
jgi:photosystem II stability/assembly factor-like uncharacterized protein